MELKYNVGDIIYKSIHNNGSCSRDCYYTVEILRIAEIRIFAGSPLTHQKPIIRYECFNEKTGEVVKLNDTEIQSYKIRREKTW